LQHPLIGSWLLITTLVGLEILSFSIKCSLSAWLSLDRLIGDHSGRLTRAFGADGILEKLKVTSLHKLFQEMDKNGNGSLHFEEFR
jgi:hypothetical protein